jgi:tRNA(Ile2) C34 agmatinyltransferase TiaS
MENEGGTQVKIIATTCPRCLVQTKKMDGDVYRCQSCKRPWPPRKVPSKIKDLFTEEQQSV